MCERFGWTLEYVDGMSVAEAIEVIDICQSADKAIAQERKKAGRARGRK